MTDVEWTALLQALATPDGFFEPLGERHSAFYAAVGPILLVSFESVDAIRLGRPSQRPLAYEVAQEHGWSCLTLLAKDQSWYRDASVFAFFDRLTDDGFFEPFKRIVFFGAGMGGYAACAFSVAAPGATVLALAPQATLDPRIAGWDTRFTDQRRMAFKDRYGYAPDMIEAADEVYLVYDPNDHLDAMHAALFTKPFVRRLPCPNLGSEIVAPLTAMGIVPKLLELAGEGQLHPAKFWQLYRGRRDYPPYLRSLVARLGDDRPMLSAIACRNIIHRLDAPRFRTRLTQLEEQLKAQGRTLPLRQAHKAALPELSPADDPD